jgi:DNA-binding MarR family transcriptional regulator
VAEFYPAAEQPPSPGAPSPDRPPAARWLIIDALRRYGTDSARLGQAFAALHRLQHADLQALVAIMSAEGSGRPLTAGQLRVHLGLSSGGTSLVIDRLEAAGHIRRVRDHPTDHRVVHLRYTEQGRATGVAFFGSLGERTNALLDQFSDAELQVIERFLTGAAAALHEQVRRLEDGE